MNNNDVSVALKHIPCKRTLTNVHLEEIKKAIYGFILQHLHDTPTLDKKAFVRAATTKTALERHCGSHGHVTSRSSCCW